MDKLSVLLLLLCYYQVNGATFRLTDLSNSTYFEGQHTKDGLSITVVKDGEHKVRGFIPGNLSSDALSACNEKSYCDIKNRKGENVRSLKISPTQHGFNIIETASNCSDLVEHAYFLNSTAVHWFGGPELTTQYWPLENVKLSGEEAYVTKQLTNSGVTERYWLNSKGTFIFVDDEVPLFVDQNQRTNDTVYFISKLEGPYIRRLQLQLNYTISAHTDAKQAHLFAVNSILGKPNGHPNSKMIKEPIWTTWAKYKRDITDDIVIGFAKEIREHNYTSGGQYEIDDNWEKCYGAQEFNTKNFAKINSTVQALKDMNFRVSLWIHPFVDDTCEERSQEGLSKGYFVQNTSGSTKAIWWNSENSHQIDFTIPEAVEWFSNRLKKLQNSPGIDSFKFDAGETSWGPQPAIYPQHENVYDWPNILTQDYIKAVSKFGDLIEFRSGWRTQQLSNFIRIIDKDSNWSFYNGLPTLITTLLTLNMVGYGMVLPDMIGGNGYSYPPTAELLVRWAQANTFMPAMQFSYLPWDFKDVSYDIEGIVKNCVNLHEEYAPSIIQAMKNNVANGTPVNVPIWWIDPTDEIALVTWDEFLLGEDILVAPVVEEKATQRNVYLPKGIWIDGNNKTETFTGPVWITYDAPIDVLPFFLKKN